MFDTPVSTETDLAETASRPLASVQPASRPVASQRLESQLLDPRPTDPRKKCPDLLANEITTLAGHLNAAQYRFLKKRLDTSPIETEIRREERFYCFEEDDETMVLGGRVSIEQGQLLVKALDAMVAEMEKDEREAASETTENVSAETSATASEPNVSAGTSVAESGANGSSEVSAATSGRNVSAETSSNAKPDRTPFKPLRVRRATALVHIAEHYLATRGSGATPLKSSDAYQVIVHVNANDAHPDNRINGAHTTYMDDRRYRRRCLRRGPGRATTGRSPRARRGDRQVYRRDALGRRAHGLFHGRRVVAVRGWGCGLTEVHRTLLSDHR